MKRKGVNKEPGEIGSAQHDVNWLLIERHTCADWKLHLRFTISPAVTYLVTTESSAIVGSGSSEDMVRRAASVWLDDEDGVRVGLEQEKYNGKDVTRALFSQEALLSVCRVWIGCGSVCCCSLNQSVFPFVCWSLRVCVWCKCCLCFVSPFPPLISTHRRSQWPKDQEHELRPFHSPATGRSS